MVKKPEYKDLPKLREAMERDYRVMQIFRQNLVRHVKEYVGSHYSDNGSDRENPVNLISLYVRIVTGILVGADPRWMVSTFDPALRQYIKTFEEHGNRKFVDVQFGEVLRRAVFDALFLVGIVKNSLISPCEARFGGTEKISGEWGMFNVQFQDFVCDTRATIFSECAYMGHRYAILLEEAKQTKSYNAKARSLLTAKDEDAFNDGGDERIERIGRGLDVDNESLEDYVEVWEIYLPRQGLVVLFDADGEGDEPLLVQEWIGPKTGPFDFLSFGDVPGSLFPKSPIMDLIDPHRTVNLLTRKLDNQASRAKMATLYQDTDDAEKIQNCKDGDFVQSNNPEAVREVMVGSGPNQNVAVWSEKTRNLFSQHAGNLDALGGLAAQSDTVGQEKIVTESASNLIRSMGMRVAAFGQRQMKKAGWFIWKNPYETHKATYSPRHAPNTTIRRSVSPADRVGKDFEDLDITINPYSLQTQTPQQRMMMIDDLVMKVILPVMPMLGQPGVSDLLEAYIKMKAHYANNPDLIELMEKVIGIQGPNPEEQAQPEGPEQPNEPTVNTRISKPGMTEQGHQQVLQQLLAGGTPPPGAEGGGLGQMSPQMR